MCFILVLQLIPSTNHRIVEVSQEHRDSYIHNCNLSYMWYFARFHTICTIWKTWKTPKEQCYFLVLLFTFTETNTPPGFFTFFQLYNDTKSRNPSHMFCTCGYFYNHLKLCKYSFKLKPATLRKCNTPPWVFLRFFNCTNDTKSRYVSHMFWSCCYFYNHINLCTYVNIHSGFSWCRQRYRMVATWFWFVYS